MFANFVINLLAGCLFLMLLGWTVDLLVALRRPAPSEGARPARPCQ